MKQVLSVLILFLAVLSLSATAQEKPNNPAVNPYVLEVAYFKGRPPALQTITPASAKTAVGAWYALFGRVKDWRQPAYTLPVRAVNIVSQMKDKAVKARVSVYSGENLYDREEFVADYTLRENETVSVSELNKFGVEPCVRKRIGMFYETRRNPPQIIRSGICSKN